MNYQYTECGLDYIYIYGLKPVKDDEGEECFPINNINQLHQLIAEAIVTQIKGLGGKELRFLRTEMGYTQAELAQIVKKDTQTIGRWERGETEIDQNAEFLIRSLAKERLKIQSRLTIPELAALCIPTLEGKSIPLSYHPDHPKDPYRLMKSA